MISPDTHTFRELALELISNIKSDLEKQLAAIAAAEKFVKELRIDELVVHREEAARTIFSLIFAIYPKSGPSFMDLFKGGSFT